MRTEQRLHIDLDRAKELVHKALAARGPSYVYARPPLDHHGDPNESSCYYVHGPELWESGDEAAPSEPCPGCIVGYALHEAGVPLDTLRDCGDGSEDGGGSDPADQLMRNLWGDGVLTYSPDAARYLQRVQGAQDVGVSWGKAVRNADEWPR